MLLRLSVIYIILEKTAHLKVKKLKRKKRKSWNIRIESLSEISRGLFAPISELFAFCFYFLSETKIFSLTIDIYSLSSCQVFIIALFHLYRWQIWKEKTKHGKFVILSQMHLGLKMMRNVFHIGTVKLRMDEA